MGRLDDIKRKLAELQRLDSGLQFWGASNHGYRLHANCILLLRGINGNIWSAGNQGDNWLLAGRDPNRLDFLDWYESWLDSSLMPGALESWLCFAWRSSGHPTSLAIEDHSLRRR
jgi:hypothetical protein